ncbi:MAG: peptidylprolyl isomerase, partial [Sedimentisphaerales bacterium]|nr:peptidylprolyl isomerase [Sedimentisphaerales bacterium]
MPSRRRIFFYFIGILFLAVVAGFITIPRNPSIHIGSWSFSAPLKLGLDIQGGTHLVYSADMKDIPAADQASALAGVRDVIERRVNSMGVAEPLVQTQQSGSDYRVIVDLAGITDINQAIQLIGETPSLDFRELESTPGTEPPIDVNAVRTQAEAVLKRTLAGEDFSSLANEFSQDPGNTSQDGTTLGGDLGWARKGQFVAAFDTALFDQLKDGEITPQLVESDFGLHIIKRIESREVTENGQQVLEVHAQHILFSTQQPGSNPTFIRTELTGK